ncbi:MAG: tRNA pseudouridine(55) synthase TruB [Oscillospiraceae bacterium]|nr:tRNA pseudouridine(55) synthase TruB [Oscillospiraceae bacterium]
MNGIICVYKPTGYTSFDIIAIMRRLLNTKKIGHSGTLDPIAEGVLPVFAGAATRAIDYCPDTDKEYRAGFRIGTTTDTQDISGQELSRVNSNIPDEVLLSRIKAAILNYIGEIEQIPPMYSAVKVKGKRLYDLARKGIEVERTPRKITVHSIEIEHYADSEGIIKISCSKGTYVRTLIHDIGQSIGFGAVMTALQRTKSNGFALGDCYTLEELREIHAANPAKLESLLKPLDILFDYPKGYLDERQTELYRNGAILNADLVKLQQIYDGFYSLYDSDNRIVALAKIGEDHSLLIEHRFHYSGSV